jgi:hypothetical protein
MYYVPVIYFGINNNNIYRKITNKLKNSILILKKKYYQSQEISNYVEYKNNLIGLILIIHGYKNPEETGNILLDKIMKKWKISDIISDNLKNKIYDQSIININNSEKTINNIEEILMIINLQILEYYYFN